MKILFLSAWILVAAPAFAEDTDSVIPTPAPIASPVSTADPTLAPSVPTTSVDNDEIIYEKTLKQIAVLISSQVRPCWKIPASTNSAPLEALVHIDPVGNLRFTGFAGEVNPDQKELAKSVKDAIADPKCNPIKNLPPQELYEVWENLPLLFAPKN